MDEVSEYHDLCKEGRAFDPLVSDFGWSGFMPARAGRRLYAQKFQFLDGAERRVTPPLCIHWCDGGSIRTVAVNFSLDLTLVLRSHGRSTMPARARSPGGNWQRRRHVLQHVSSCAEAIVRPGRMAVFLTWVSQGPSR